MAMRALRTALGQTLPPTQLVVVDDASDPPFELSDVDARVALIRLERSRGVSAARNAGLAKASCEWVTFLDDDDELVPTMLESSLSRASSSVLPPPVAVLSGVPPSRWATASSSLETSSWASVATTRSCRAPSTASCSFA
jgi:glycosyltransferase involved in cell wall biosynthesis